MTCEWEGEVSEYFIYPQIWVALSYLISSSISYPNPQYNNNSYTTTPGISCPTLYDKLVDPFVSPTNHNIEDAGDGADDLLYN